MRSPTTTAAATLAAATLAAAATSVATAQDTVPTMEPFEAHLACAGAASAERTVWKYTVEEVSDPRFDGTHYSHLEGWEDGDPDMDGIGAYAGLWEIRTDDGSWVGEYDTFRFAPYSYSTFSAQLDGHGAYENLEAIMEADWRDDCGWDLRGVVIGGELPAHPQPLDG
jgi:hypothetical protein